MNNPVLIGAEAVEHAGRMMLTAAESMNRAANSMAESAEKMRQSQRDMDFTLSNHQRFLDNWLERLHQTLENVLPVPGEPLPVCLVKTEEEEETENRSEMPTMPAPEPDDNDEIEGPMD